MERNSPTTPQSPNIIEISTDDSNQMTAPSVAASFATSNSINLGNNRIMNLARMVHNSCQHINDYVLETGLAAHNVQHIQITTIQDVFETFHGVCKKIEALNTLLGELYYDQFYNEGNASKIKDTFHRYF